jgi:hypothetical protein
MRRRLGLLKGLTNRIGKSIEAWELFNLFKNRGDFTDKSYLKIIISEPL